MILYIVLGILGFVIVLFLESLLLSLFGISILFLLFLFFYKIVNLKTLLSLSLFVTLFLDVVLNLPLGITFLTFLLSLCFYYMLSIFFALESGFFANLFKFLTLFFFNVISYVLQRVFTFGNLGYFDINMFWSFLLKSFAALLVLVFLEYISKRLRSSQSGGTLKFK